jgi:Ca2+-binding RTX toxin-like protein
LRSTSGTHPDHRSEISRHSLTVGTVGGMPRLAAAVALVLGVLASLTLFDGLAQSACQVCADHKEWPRIDGRHRQAHGGSKSYVGTAKNDELLGHHGSDTLSGRDGSDVLWGDWDPKGQSEGQHDTIFGGDGSDFIYGSHGTNTIYAGAGNDVVSVHYGRGLVDCGPGRDIYHVARSRKKLYRFRHCEKVDYRPEKVRGGGLKPLP